MAPLGGTSVGALAARSLLGAVDRAVAVVRPGDDQVARLLEAEGFEALPFPGAEDGMGASLSFGVSAVPEADGWIVALADMPFVLPATVSALAGLLSRGALITAPCFEGLRGHPVGFGKSLLPELVHLRGDQGARSLLAAHEEEVVLLQCDDPGTLRDVDIPSDLGPDRVRMNR